MTFPLFRNPQARRGPYPPALAGIIGLAAHAQAAARITRWPGYAPTPLHRLDGYAARAGAAGVWYKDEGPRFGLGSFKALGGAYAVERLLAERAGSDDTAALRAAARGMTVACATDGNHGRSVAWGAERLGCRCVIYLHAGVSEGREAAIRRYGAEIRRVAGTYDDSVHQAAADAAHEGWTVVSDTSYPGYDHIPRLVMQGYQVMVQEALEQMGGAPTHVFLQGGVGGLAAAVVGHLWDALGDARPTAVVVEPERAACLYESARAGRPVALTGDIDTVMAGLCCGEVSLLAWDILREGADWFATLPDAAVPGLMRGLADGEGGVPVVAGESAVAGLGALLRLAADPEARRTLGIDSGSRILVFGTEGDTDPVLYEKLVGRPAAAVGLDRPAQG